MKTDLRNKCKNLKRQIELINYYYPNKKNNSFCQKLFFGSNALVNMVSSGL